ncbi:acyltransferase family protein [Microbulbifer elongatus]|uniref:acyltransferase family protein n=1 Tax=Microbulbifer elongatus TaxID=86173 RepID=UPI001CFC8363|nr:acyltransferase [Microbulbifer elongatus]
MPKKFQWIDSFRGIAALVVVIFHYHHFYLSDNRKRGEIPSVETFPFAQILEPVYIYGHWAVELFWAISGFVFYHVYLKRKAGILEFVSFRVARLYPLHVATLVFVALLQYVSMQTVGHWQVYGNNDSFHFVLQLLLATNWSSVSHGLSYNGPIWSVSLEVAAYAMFFISLTAIRHSPILISVALVFATWILAAGYPSGTFYLSASIFQCACYFFCGGLTYCLSAITYNRPARFDGLSVTLLILLALIAVINIEGIAGYLACMGIVYFAALLEKHFKHCPKSLLQLGDLSFSVYLVHVPLQITLLLIMDLAFNGDRSFANSIFTLPIYITVTILAASATYKYYELPARKLVRNAFDKFSFPLLNASDSKQS